MTVAAISTFGDETILPSNADILHELPGRRGGTRKFVYRGRLYHRDSRHHDRYRCALRGKAGPTRGCPGAIRLNEEGQVIVVHEHVGHNPVPNLLRREQFLHECMQRARTSFRNLETIFNEVRLEMAFFEFQYRDLRRVMQNARRGVVPRMPIDLNDAADILEDYDEFGPFYKGSFHAADGSTGLVFMRDEMVEPLSRCTQIFIDGTHKLTRDMIDEINDPRLNRFGRYLNRYWLPLRIVLSVWNQPVRTNNLCEIFNRLLRARMGDHPTFWAMLGMSIPNNILMPCCIRQDEGHAIFILIGCLHNIAQERAGEYQRVRDGHPIGGDRDPEAIAFDNGVVEQQLLLQNRLSDDANEALHLALTDDDINHANINGTDQSCSGTSDYDVSIIESSILQEIHGRSKYRNDETNCAKSPSTGARLASRIHNSQIGSDNGSNNAENSGLMPVNYELSEEYTPIFTTFMTNAQVSSPAAPEKVQQLPLPRAQVEAFLIHPK
ncbi:hypothetical protein QAD02_008114 [Eretmocerus hayati]|uniref:Uncharacterized protein n=1 Tax=Eretmocerus hayati TaxID=131215 RepID=A0ACC2N5L6_9HYME|nr:hypothetical protein QAD02_008114 [Eretmocerus hayati]